MLKLVAISYLLKTVLLAAAWVAIPDLPDRASARAREAWALFFEKKTR